MIYTLQSSVEQLQVYIAKPATSFTRFFTIFLTSNVSGICAKTVIAPAERIKMSFQVSSERFTLEKALTRTVSQSILILKYLLEIQNELYTNG